MKRNGISDLRIVIFVICALFAVAVAPAFGAVTTRERTTRRYADSGGTIIVPDHFLHLWDPVTIFFANRVGPGGHVPEDAPGRFVRVTPQHPGAYTWIDGKTLQFRPSVPWKPFETYIWKADGKTFTLVTLADPPVSTNPPDGAEGLDKVDTLVLTFAHPVSRDALRKMIVIEYRPAPGVAADTVTRLDWNDFSVQLPESREDSGFKVKISLNNPVPRGTFVTVVFRLAPDAPDTRCASISFSTAAAFRLVSAGSRTTRVRLVHGAAGFTRSDAVALDRESPEIVLEFSTPPEPIDILQGQNLIKITPPPEDLHYRVEKNTLRISGAFLPDTLYQAALSYQPLRDINGRRLAPFRGGNIYFYRLREPPFLRMHRPNGIVERYGPKFIPLEGRGVRHLDLRIFAIDPYDRSFWPFPAAPVSVDESEPPEPSGTEPVEYTNDRNIYLYALKTQLRNLGSPPFSGIVDVPSVPADKTARFGLNLEKFLKKISGENAPGTYLVGIRKPDSMTRSWMRVQSTDLCLTSFENQENVMFLVTSYRTARPVPGAEIVVESSSYRDGWHVAFRGETNQRGFLDWSAFRSRGNSIRRIIVRKGRDVLILDPETSPEVFHDNQWNESGETWLQWTQYSREPGNTQKILGHIFTDRPVYRPDETVFIDGYIRKRSRGILSRVDMEGVVEVILPDGSQREFPVVLDDSGSFHLTFRQEEPVTGEFYASFRTSRGMELPGCTFRMESYRIPKFEVRLDGPATWPLDSPFDIKLTASYYAGGVVSRQPVNWRVTRFPYHYTPPGKRFGAFHFSTDKHISGDRLPAGEAALHYETFTDAYGLSSLSIDPGEAETASPEKLVIEATVIDSDEQTVTAVTQVKLTPAFILGINIPRCIEYTGEATPEIVVLDGEGNPLPGKDITLRLIQRQWHSHIRAGDFSSGFARYVTDVVDEPVLERRITSADHPLSMKIPLKESGVYIVEIESHDAFGRAQVVSVDFFAGGSRALNWSKPSSHVFEAVADKKKYDPGETAAIILKSPFQTAEAVAALEAPDGNRYEHLPVRNGKAVYHLAIEKRFAPRIPVHFLLLRKRLPGVNGDGVRRDMGKPATMAATVWLDVSPRDNLLDVALDYPKKARPGDTVDVSIRLRDSGSRPRQGAVKLWLVDEAVLALGKERFRNPLDDFLSPLPSRMRIRDTRNLTFGFIPLSVNPGGGMPAFSDESLFHRITVRKNFSPVPYFNPNIPTDAQGTARVRITLPDNLTNFALRAKAASGEDLFGIARGRLAVRLPVIVQPALPRFVRPGDDFMARIVNRVIEGEGGPGKCTIQLDGLALVEPFEPSFQWSDSAPTTLDIHLSVPGGSGADISAARGNTARFTASSLRISDGAGDAISREIPIRSDVEPVVRRKLHILNPSRSLAIPGLRETPRAGSERRRLYASADPAMIRMIQSLNILMSYPYGCTEQRISAARSWLRMKRFRSQLGDAFDDSKTERIVSGCLEWLPQVVQDGGLCAYWPNGDGSVTLTAWTVAFLCDAQKAGISVDEQLFRRLLDGLERSLASGGAADKDAYRFNARCWALEALMYAGRLEPGYATELAAKAEYLDAESLALVLKTLAESGTVPDATIRELEEKLREKFDIRLQNGTETIVGLRDFPFPEDNAILATEVRAIAESIRALTAAGGAGDTVEMLWDALMRYGSDSGWGSTNADAEAILAITQLLDARADAPECVLEITSDRWNDTLALDASRTVDVVTTPYTGEIQVRCDPCPGTDAVYILEETRCIPASSGADIARIANGFVVSSEALKVAGENAPMERFPVDVPGTVLSFASGDVIEMHVQVVNPKFRNHVAVTIPLAAGLEPLNPNLDTAPPEAVPSGKPTREASYACFGDDHIDYFYDTLDKGAYDFYFRCRAMTPGRFILPPPKAELMYHRDVFGTGNGAILRVVRED